LFTTCKARGEFLYMPGGGSLHPAPPNCRKKMHYITRKGARYLYAVRAMAELACEMLERNGFTSRDLALVVPHQANLRISAANAGDSALNDSKVMITSNATETLRRGPFLGLRGCCRRGETQEG